MTKPIRFSQPVLIRAGKAMEKAGLCVAGAEIAPDGTIRVLTGAALAANDRTNPTTTKADLVERLRFTDLSGRALSCDAQSQPTALKAMDRA